MPRGFDWAVYHDDADGLWALQVDRDLRLQSQRGWDTLAPAGTTPFPRQWLPRIVYGVEPSGRRHRAIVASTAAELWTGARADFDIVDSNGELQTCLVYKRVSEWTRRRPTGNGSQ